MAIITIILHRTFAESVTIRYLGKRQSPNYSQRVEKKTFF